MSSIDIAGPSDKGVPYVAMRYTQRLAEAGAVAPRGLRRAPMFGIQLLVQR